jgi:hypothetical protein
MLMPLQARRYVMVPVAGALICLPAWAAFTGNYAQANWTPFTQTFGCGSSQVDTAGMPNTLVLRTFTGCANIGAGYTLTGIIPANGTLSFNWSYDSTSFNDAGVVTSATYTLAGVTTTVASNDGPQSGTVSIPVLAGQSFSLTLNGSTNATYTITNFNGPGAITPVPTLDTWAKIGMAGLLGLTAAWAMRRQRRSTSRSSQA